MKELFLEHALYGCQQGGYQFLAQSPGIDAQCQQELQQICTSFGERPPGVSCPRAVFAYPLSNKRVVVAQVADQGVDDTGRPGALSFYLLIFPIELYRYLGGDPFFLATRYPVIEHAQGELTPRSCFPEPAPPRLLPEIESILKDENSPTFLGSVQALLDGGRLAFERSEPDEKLVQNLWSLLPTSSRWEMWPTSFAFGNALGFHVLVTPRVDEETKAVYVSEEHAGDYPEGRYELRLQMATEAGDQQELDRLFSRRSPKDTIRLGFLILILALAIPLAASFISWVLEKTSKRDNQFTPVGSSQPKVKSKFTPSKRFAQIPVAERIALRNQLLSLVDSVQAPFEKDELRARQGAALLGWVTPSPGMLRLHLIPALRLPHEDQISADALILTLDQWLSNKRKMTNSFDLSTLNPIQKRMQGLLWKYDVERYNDPRLTTVEMLERLIEKVPEL